MGIIKSIKNRLERRRVRRDMMGDIMDRLSVDASGRVVITERPGTPEKERAALSVSTLFRCVQLISNAIASMPVHHQRHADGVWRDADTTLERLLTVEPNYYISAFDFWRAAVRGMLLDGVSYIVPRRDDRGNITYLQLFLDVNVAVDEVKHRYTAPGAGPSPSPAATAAQSSTGAWAAWPPRCTPRAEPPTSPPATPPTTAAYISWRRTWTCPTLS